MIMKKTNVGKTDKNHLFLHKFTCDLYNYDMFITVYDDYHLVC